VTRENIDAVKMDIANVAIRYDVTHRTLRFYEKRGLLKPERVGNKRLFGPSILGRLEFILKLRSIGFTLNEIGELLNDRAGGAGRAMALPPEIVARQIAHLERQRARLEEAVATLQRDFMPRTP
jgi:DNA-binding transcriptional MerR regulator